MEIINAITTYFSGTLGQVELAGTIFSLICVYLAVRHNIWTWFYGFLGVVCFGYLFFEYQLYSDALLQIAFYAPMQLIGWYWWKNEAEETTVHTLNPRSLIWIIFGIIVATMINGQLMYSYTDASFPFIDAFTTWMSITAQILMVKKFWESWVFWVTMDVVAIGVYFAKGLMVTSGLYIIFLILASYGLYVWYKGRKNV